MPAFLYEPPIHSHSTPSFLQTIRAEDGDTLIGTARWHVTGADVEGAVQILDLSIEPPHRRKGQGRLLLDALTQQAKAYFRLRRSNLRRLWIVVEQKRQVIGRAFLMANGFHHVITLPHLLRDEDALTYVRSFD
jgi:GNAT superfamily N-acetyltransferase